MLFSQTYNSFSNHLILYYNCIVKLNYMYYFQVASHLDFERSMAYNVCHAPLKL